eukprot:gene6868-8756_t
MHHASGMEELYREVAKARSTDQLARVLLSLESSVLAECLSITFMSQRREWMRRLAVLTADDVREADDNEEDVSGEMIEVSVQQAVLDTVDSDSSQDIESGLCSVAIVQSASEAVPIPELTRQFRLILEHIHVLSH